ncbi:MAG: hypothetical protein EB060_06620 [Proteobacteria bacterium]|nr:hypothetical protein [Pseudomonadota bacterium]
MLPKRRKKPSSDRIFLLIAVLLIGYVMYISSDPTAKKDDKDTAEIQTNEAPVVEPDNTETTRFDAVKETFDTTLFDPNFAKSDPRITNPADLRRGAGEYALCGNEVTLHYTLLDKNEKVLADSHAKDAPITFKLGGDTSAVMKWIPLHVLGMKAGGLREMTILPQWWSEEKAELLPKELKGKLKEDAITKARIELVSVDQDPGSAPVFPSTYLKTQGNINKPIQCGQTVKAEIYNISGWRGEDVEPMSKRPMMAIDYTSGNGTLPKWLEQGIVGNGVILPMMMGGERHIVLTKEMVADVSDEQKAFLTPLGINFDKDAAIAVKIIDPDAPAVLAPAAEAPKEEAPKADAKKDPKAGEGAAEKKDAAKKEPTEKTSGGKDADKKVESVPEGPSDDKADDSFAPPEE